MVVGLFWLIAISAVSLNSYLDAAPTGCYWKETINMHIPNGQHACAVNNVLTCQALCVATPNCQSIDWDIATLSCYLHYTQQGQDCATGTIHYDYICTVPGPTTPPQTEPPLVVPTNPPTFPVETQPPPPNPTTTVPEPPPTITESTTAGPPPTISAIIETTTPGRVTTENTPAKPEPTTTTAKPEPPTTITEPVPLPTTTTTTTTTTTLPPTTTAFGPEICKQKIDLAFVVDASSSICGNTTCNNWKINLQFIRRVINSKKIGPDDTRVAIITFADSAVLTFYLDAYKDNTSLLAAVDNVVYTGGLTDTTGAFQLLLSDIFVPQHGDRPDVPNTAIIITDGAPNPNKRTLLKNTVAEAHKRHIKCLAVGITKEVKVEVLELISSPPHKLNQDYFTATSYDTLDDVRVELDRNLCLARI